jgi:hydrogenase 3 maturation protease
LVAEILGGIFADDLSQTLVVTLGNRLRSDDGVGPWLAKSLQGVDGLLIESAEQRPERCLGRIERERPSLVVFIDAADFGGAPGELRLIAAEQLGGRSFSTHRLPLAPLATFIAWEYGTRCVFLGIQAVSLALGESLSQAVAATSEEMIAWFRRPLTIAEN